MAITLGTFTKLDDGVFTGTLKTLNVVLLHVVSADAVHAAVALEVEVSATFCPTWAE